MENDTKTVYKVPERNLAELQARITKLAKRAAKLHSDPVTLTVLGFNEIKKPATDYALERVIRIYDVTVSGPAPKINGWEFIAVLEPITSEDGTTLGNILRAVPDASKPLPESYRTAQSFCDHCKTQRRRNETFVLANETGEYKQVGRQCLRDFLGHASPESYASLAQIIMDCASACRDSEYEDCLGRGPADRYMMEEVLMLAASSIRQTGWKSSTSAREFGGESTASVVSAWIDCRPDERKKWKTPLVIADSDKALAAAVVEWLGTLESRPELNDYYYNLSMLSQAATITRKNFGIACSAIATYSREMEKEINRRKRFEEDSNSQYVGEIGQRTKLTATLVHTTELGSQYGVTHLYKFKDENSNVLVWFASNIYWNPTTGQDIALGDVVVLDAGIKAHEEYKGIKQTMITRAKAWVSPEEKKAAAKARKAEKAAAKARKAEKKAADKKREDENRAANPNFYNAMHPDFGKLTTDGEKEIQAGIARVNAEIAAKEAQ